MTTDDPSAPAPGPDLAEGDCPSCAQMKAWYAPDGNHWRVYNAELIKERDAARDALAQAQADRRSSDELLGNAVAELARPRCTYNTCGGDDVSGPERLAAARAELAALREAATAYVRQCTESDHLDISLEDELFDRLAAVVRGERG